MYGPRQDEAWFADGRLHAFAWRLFESFGVRHETVGPMAALETNDA